MSKTIDYVSEYDNSARVADADILIDSYATDAAHFRREFPKIAEYDQAYGEGLRNQMDIFWPETKAGNQRQCPIVMFIHGGYWRSMDRSSFSHMASGLLAHDVAVAIPSYTLCPDIPIAGIIRELQHACLFLYQKYGRALTVMGHSAGGHLAACMMATDWNGMNPGLPEDMVASGLGISGLYELTPLLQTPVNDAVRMDYDQAIQASPIKWVPNGLAKFDAWVGADESGEYHRQSQQLAERWSMLGTPSDYVSEPGMNHFTIIDALTDPQSRMVNRVLELINEPTLEIEVPKPTAYALRKKLKEIADENGIQGLELTDEEAEEEQFERELSEAASELTVKPVKKRTPPVRRKSKTDKPKAAKRRANKTPAKPKPRAPKKKTTTEAAKTKSASTPKKKTVKRAKADQTQKRKTTTKK